MNRTVFPLLRASAGASARTREAGFWRLGAGQALGLHAPFAAELRIVRGKVWVTLGDATKAGVPSGARVAGDVFLQAGEVLKVPPGARLVFEPLGDASVLFDWAEDFEHAVAVRDRFGREVLAPARDLWRALRQVLLASARLVQGVLGYGEFVVAGRGRLLAPLEGNPP